MLRKASATSQVVNLTSLLASVGLKVSVSHDLGEITCEIACNLIILFINILFIGIRDIY